MKIAVIFDNFGPYHFARLAASARVCELIAVEVAASSSDYAWKREEQAPDAGAINAKQITLFEGDTARAVHRRELGRRITQALDACRPEVVCIPGWSSRLALVALAWCAKHNVPAVAMSESTEWDDHRVWWKEAVKRQLINLCDAALVGGAPHKDYIVKLGMSPEGVFLGYDSVDNRHFADNSAEIQTKSAEYRKRYGLPKKYFLASARFIAKKNLPFLLEAYALYRRHLEAARVDELGFRHPNSGPWDLVLLGDGPLRSGLCRLISDLQIGAFVRVPGFKQYRDLPAFYGLAKAFIHTSCTEPWGLVVNEAMASGLPVLVSSRCGCASELVRDGENGFTFDPTDKGTLTQFMIKISADDANLNAMGLRSRQLVEAWSPEAFAQSLKSACEYAITARQGKRRHVARVVLDISLKLPDNVFNKSAPRAGSNGESRPLPAVTIKPNFFIIGAPKSGTTSLCEYLKDHPNVYFSRVKEPHFFDSDTSTRLKLNQQTYLSLFSKADPSRHKAVGEASTGYLFSKAAVPRIIEFSPNAKFIVMLRNPVDMVQSWHSEMFFEGVEDVSEFETAWRLEKARRLGRSVPQACWETKKLFYSEWGRLGDQVERLFSVVSRDRVKVIVFDDFVADTKRVYEEVLEFLRVPSHNRAVFEPVNEHRKLKHARLQRRLASLANYVRLFRVTSGLKLSLGSGLFHKALLLNSRTAAREAPSPILRAELSDFFRNDIQKLSKLLSRDLSCWITDSPKAT